MSIFLTYWHHHFHLLMLGENRAMKELDAHLLIDLQGFLGLLQDPFLFSIDFVLQLHFRYIKTAYIFQIKRNIDKLSSKLFFLDMQLELHSS